MRKTTKITAAVAGGALAVVTAGAAYAYWTTSGSGSASGTAALTAGTLSLSGPTTAVTGLVPGGSISVPITASNSSTTTSLQATTLSVTNLHSNKPDCDLLAAADYATVAAVQPTSAVLVAPGGSQPFGSVTVGMPNTANDQSVCKGAVFSFDVSAS